MAAVIYLIVEPRVYGGSLPPSLVVFLHGCCVDILKEALCAGQIRIPLGSRGILDSLCLDMLNCMH